MKHTHSKHCHHNDNDKMLYAKMEIKDNEFILISANETALYDELLESALNGDEGLTIDSDTADNESYQLVYGAFMIQDGVSYEEAEKHMNDIKNYALVSLDEYLTERNDIKASSYQDIVLYPEYSKHDQNIPFAAIMQTTSRINEDAETSVTMFPIIYDLKVWEAMVNRKFLLACRRTQLIDGMTLENWKDFINLSDLLNTYKVADLLIEKDEPTDLPYYQ